MKLNTLLAVFIALFAATAIAQATSCDTHEKAAAATGAATGAAPEHDDDSSSHDENNSSSDDSSSHKEGEEGEESELHEQMELIGKNFKKLNRLFREETPDINQALKHIARCKKGANASKDLVPELVEEMEEGKEKDAALKQFQEQITKLSNTFNELEEFLKEGDTAKARGMLNLLKKQKKEGHDRFIEDEEESHAEK